ncbi:MAG: tagaturonate reductase [Tepidisphaeraceae bacterium]
MSLPKLNKSLVSSSHAFPSDVNVNKPKDLPEKVLQFGEGGFLRGFVDWMINKLNAAGEFNGRVVVVQPIPQGMVDKLNAQDGLYTHILRGVVNGQTVEDKEIVASISRGLNPYTQFDEYMACARNPDLRVIVSNTTEAGIVFRAEDSLTDKPPVSYPGKLTQFLFERYKALGESKAKGFIILPCELIERNGDNLKRCVLQTAEHWKMPATFIEWLKSANDWGNTLVDRIVTGYPKDEAAAIGTKLGHQDDLLNTSEPFHFWVIEASQACAKELPFDKVGLDVVFTPNMTPYRDRKVRILNGAHTMTVLAAYLAGKDTVGECMNDDLIRDFMQRGIYDEIIPTLDLPKDDLTKFAAAVTERFANPFIKHYLLSIALNSTSKFKARVLPSIKEYAKRNGGKIPQRLAFSLAALIAFYRGTELRDDNTLIGKRNGTEYKIQDDVAALQLMQKVWTTFKSTDTSPLVREVLASVTLWGEDLNALPGLTDAVSKHLNAILTQGPRLALQAVA